VPVGLPLSVVATTDVGTRAALNAADDLGIGLNPQIILWVLHAVPYLQPLHASADAIAFNADRFRRLSEEARAEVLVRVCVCRPEAAGLETILPLDALVLIGGNCHRWWCTREQRLAQRLAGRGYSVLFIDSELTGETGPGPVQLSSGSPSTSCPL
jgi:hypothetical protein